MEATNGPLKSIQHCTYHVFGDKVTSSSEWGHLLQWYEGFFPLQGFSSANSKHPPPKKNLRVVLEGKVLKIVHASSKSFVLRNARAVLGGLKAELR